MALLGTILLWVIQGYFILLLVRAVLSWIPLIAPNFSPRGIIASLFEIIYTLTDPPLRWLGRWIPPLRLGTVSLDLAFIVLLIILMVFQRVIVQIFF